MAMTETATLGEWIEQRRRDRGWSQFDLMMECYAADNTVVVRDADISRYESDSREPTYAKLLAICKTFGETPPLHLLRRVKGRYTAFSLATELRRTA